MEDKTNIVKEKTVEKMNELEIKLTKLIENKVKSQEKVSDGKNSIINKRIDTNEESIKNINSLISTLDENIRSIQKENINIFVACHNQVNKSNQITIEHLGGLFKEHNKLTTKLAPLQSNNNTKSSTVVKPTTNNTKPPTNASN